MKDGRVEITGSPDQKKLFSFCSWGSLYCLVSETNDAAMLLWLAAKA